MGEYRVMHWYSDMDGPWSPEASQRFQEQGFDGLAVIPSQEWVPRNLDFLRELAGLRSFSYTGRLTQDLTAFELESLEDLTLVTGSKLPVPNTPQTNLVRLVATDRPGLVVSPRWSNLLSLRIGGWRGHDLFGLDRAARLTHLHLEARRQKGSIEGIQRCASLESLVLVNYSIASAAPLRGLHSLTEIKLLAAEPTSAHDLIDLSALAAPKLSKIWISNAAILQNIDSLKWHSSLRELRLIGCRLSDSDMTSISSPPRRVTVQIVNG